MQIYLQFSHIEASHCLKTWQDSHVELVHCPKYTVSKSYSKIILLLLIFRIGHFLIG